LRAQRLWFAISIKPSIYLMGILVYCCPSCQVQMFPQTWIVIRFPHDWTGRHGIGSCQHYSLELQRSIGFLWELQQICTQLNPTMLPTLTDWLTDWLHLNAASNFLWQDLKTGFNTFQIQTSFLRCLQNTTTHCGSIYHKD
jgi:hypothetical protein